MKRLLAALAGIASLCVAPAIAHHSFSAEFDASQPITLRGKLTKMEWINPHGWLHIDVSGPDGTVVNWAIEAGSPNQLLRRGLRQADFPLGSEVIIDGYRHRTKTTTAIGSTVKFADGRNFFLGAPTDNAPPGR